MKEMEVQFVSYYTGPYVEGKPEIPYQEINPHNPVLEGEKYFAPLRMKFESRGEDPRSFIFSFWKEVSNQIKFQFKKKRKELYYQLKEEYKIIPQFQSFVAWYLINRYEPLIRKLKPKIYWTLEPSTSEPIHKDALPLQLRCEPELPPCFSPIVTDQDILQYVNEKSKDIQEFKKNQSLENNILPEASNKPKALHQLNQSKAHDPLKWYLWNSTQKQLSPKIHHALVSNGYIDCPLEDFEGAFGIREFEVGIKWIKVDPDKPDKENASLIIFLVRYLQHKEILIHHDRQKWSELKKIIIKPNGKRFKQDFAQLNKHVDLLKPTKSQQELADLIGETLK